MQRVRALFHEGRSCQTTIAKLASPRQPRDVPRASSAAACRPRAVLKIPARAFRSLSCFSISVALAGKIAGTAKNKPPTAGPCRFAMRPAATVITPPKKNLIAYSYHFVLESAEKLARIIVLIYFRNMNHDPNEKANQTRRPDIVLTDARKLNFFITVLQKQA
jgi:hypothetical protein